MDKKYISHPFARQLFVTLGHSLAMSQFGLVLGFTSSLLPQLRSPDSFIHLDDATGSWIAAIPHVASAFGTLTTPLLMGKYGRKPASIVSLALFTFSWLIISVAWNITIVLVGRVIQGASLGIVIIVSPICVGENSSPKFRGGFLTLLSLSLAGGTLTAHVLGFYFSWQRRSLICAVVSFVNLILIMYSPESTYWLIEKGKYEKGTVAFRWLRGDSDEEELKSLIEADTTYNEEKLNENKLDFTILNLNGMKQKLRYFGKAFKKPELLKPIFIMINMNIILNYSGINLIASYADDIFKIVAGANADVKMAVMGCDLQRIITNIIALFFVKKFKRKSLFIFFVVLNTIMYLTLALYIYAKSVGWIAERAYLGIFLIHLLLFCVASGTLTVPIVITGEIYPLEFKTLSAVLSFVLSLPTVIFMLKTFPFFVKTIGLHGTFCICSVVLVVSLLLSLLYLPETKDKTLQQIEQLFKKKNYDDDEASVSLNKD